MEGDDVAFGAAGDGAGEVETGGGFGAPREDEVSHGGELGVDFVNGLFEEGDVFRGDGRDV